MNEGARQAANDLETGCLPQMHRVRVRGDDEIELHRGKSGPSGPDLGILDQGSGDVRNTVIVPHGYSAMQSSGGYRMIPWNSIGGEGSVTPAEHR